MIIRLGVRVKDQHVSDADFLILPCWTVFLMLFLCEMKYFLKPHVRSQARWADRGLRREVWTVWGSESIRSRFLVRGRSLRSRNPRNAGFRWNGPAGELAWESAGCGSRAFGGSTCGALIGNGRAARDGKRAERVTLWACKILLSGVNRPLPLHLYDQLAEVRPTTLCKRCNLSAPGLTDYGVAQGIDLPVVLRVHRALCLSHLGTTESQHSRHQLGNRREQMRSLKPQRLPPGNEALGVTFPIIPSRWVNSWQARLKS